MPIDTQELLNLVRKREEFPTMRESLTGKTLPEPNVAKEETVPDFELDDDGEEYIPVGVNGLLASTEKLLAMNRGLVGQDERDSLRYQKVVRPASLFRERVKMDSGKIARTIMYRAAKTKSLAGFLPGAFDGYVDAVMKGNPLTSPFEEINPMQIKEGARRITKMGPGGIPSSESITAESQAVHPSQFGFIDPISGPECFVDNDEFATRVLTSKGWKRFKDVTDDDKLACQIDGALTFSKPEHVVHASYSGEIYKVVSGAISFAVTPTHRIWGTSDPTEACYKFTYAKDLYGKVRHIPCKPGTYLGKEKGTVQIGDRTFSAKDWCEFLGWFLSEGSLRGKQYKHPSICITQSEDVHPNEYRLLVKLCSRMGIKYHESLASPNNYKKHGYTKHIGLNITERCIQEYVTSRWVDGCYNKYIPEEVFDWGLDERHALLHTLLLGDGRVNKSHTVYCTVCKRLAEDVERLAIGLGYCVRLREEHDKRAHVKTTNYCVCLLQAEHRVTDTRVKGAASYWSKMLNYNGMVHCATVPGGLLYVSVNKCPGFWTGNSERAGVDVRAAYGTKVGSDGRIYQKFYDRKSKTNRWMNPSDIAALTVKLPD